MSARTWLAGRLGAMSTRLGASATTRPSPMHDAGGHGRRLRHWNPSGAGANTVVAADAEVLRNRSRDLVRQNPWASGGVEALVSNLVGTGVTPRSQAEDPTFRQAVNRLFLDWTDEADAAGVLDFCGLQALAVRSMIESGETFARLRPRLPVDDLSVPLQVQLLEADQVPFSKTEVLPSTGIIRNGIEFDAIGAKVAVWLLREHPGEVHALLDGGQAVRVPAAQVVHLFRPLRPGQVRGAVWLAPSMLRLWELDQYDDAELVRKRGAASIGGFITSATPEDRPLVGTEDDTPADDGTTSVSFEPGTWGILRPGESVSTSLPADVGPNFDVFVTHHLRAVARGIGITYEQLTGDLTGVNYSSYRAGAIEQRRFYLGIIHSLVAFQFCRAIWRPWLDAAVLAGALPISQSAYLANRRALQRVLWVPQGWEYIDPLKEVEADIKRVRAGFTSRSGVVQERGDDPEQIEADIGEENARADALGTGVAFDSDPRKAASAAPAAAASAATAPEAPAAKPRRTARG